MSTFRAERNVFALNKAHAAGADSISGKGARIEWLTPEMGNLQSEPVGKLLVSSGKAKQFIGHAFEAGA